MKPSFGGKFSYSQKVSLYLDGLLEAAEKEAADRAREKWEQSEEYAALMQSLADKAIESLRLYPAPYDRTGKYSSDGFGIEAIVSAPNTVNGECSFKVFPLEEILDEANEDYEGEEFDLFLEEMERLLRKYGRLT